MSYTGLDFWAPESPDFVALALYEKSGSKNGKHCAVEAAGNIFAIS